MNTFAKAGRIAGAVTVAGVAAATALAVTPGTFGGFTAGTSNPGNSVQAGTVEMTNSVTSNLTFSGSGVYTASNLQPGKSASGTVTITNSGSLPATVSLDGTPSVTPDAANVKDDWALTIEDTTGATPVTIYNGDLADFGVSALSLPGEAHATNWVAGEDHTYTVTVTLKSTAGNEAQDSSVSFDLDWDSAQVG